MPSKENSSIISILKDAIKLQLEICANNIKSELNKYSSVAQFDIRRGRNDKNDYRHYIWIVAKTPSPEKEYWLALFYNDLDPKTGNHHTQIGRIQFWKNIENKSPNKRIKLKNNKKVWTFNTIDCAEPKKGFTLADEDPKTIAKDFIDFVKEDIKSNKKLR